MSGIKSLAYVLKAKKSLACWQHFNITIEASVDMYNIGKNVRSVILFKLWKLKYIVIELKLNDMAKNVMD